MARMSGSIRLPNLCAGLNAFVLTAETLGLVNRITVKSLNLSIKSAFVDNVALAVTRCPLWKPKS
jgi:hypothetical protein